MWNSVFKAAGLLHAAVHLRDNHHTHLMALFLGLPWWAGTRNAKTNLDFTEARDSEWQWHQLGHMQVWNPAPDRQPLCFLQAGCPSCCPCPTNSVKALKAKTGWIYVINTQQIKSRAQKSISSINTSSQTFSVSPWMTALSMFQSITTSVHWHQGSYSDHYFVVCQTLQSLRIRPGLQQTPSYQVRCILSSHMLQRCYWNYHNQNLQVSQDSVHIWDVTETLTSFIFVVSLGIFQWKNFENLFTFVEVFDQQLYDLLFTGTQSGVLSVATSILRSLNGRVE